MKDTNIDKLLLKYKIALKLLKDKFNKLHEEKKGEENPIAHIKGRIKDKTSIKNKLKNKYNLDLTPQNIENTLSDIAGIRIVCPFLSDINKIIAYINDDPDITVLSIKNYILDPKENGYSSYHMIVSVPIIIDDQIEQVKAEIQIRTMAMDVIASLDHKIKYKKNIKLSKEDDDKLSSIVRFVNKIDSYMDNFVQEKRLNSTPQTQTITPKHNLPEHDYETLIKKYELALKKVEETINNIKTEYLDNEMINPIEHVKGRIKTLPSIISKLQQKNQEITLENIEQYITDVGAIKVVCSFLSDVDEIINIINNQTDFIILERQDYITEPKSCGYSSYHFVVAVPIELDGEVTLTKIEIQVRTIIMDFWAKIEHILCYKKDVNTKTKDQLKTIATELRSIEPKIDELAQTVFKKTTNYKKQLKRKQKEQQPTQPN